MVLLVSLSDEDDGSPKVGRPTGDPTTFLVPQYAGRGNIDGLATIAGKQVTSVGMTNTGTLEVVHLTQRCGELSAEILTGFDPDQFYAQAKPIKNLGEQSDDDVFG